MLPWLVMGYWQRKAKLGALLVFETLMNGRFEVLVFYLSIVCSDLLSVCWVECCSWVDRCGRVGRPCSFLPPLSPFIVYIELLPFSSCHLNQ